MVPKVAGKGTSFKGAGLYYLHGKGALTAERVAFTHTENLPTDSPDLALKIMAHTAMRQDDLKAWSGQAKTGRKLAYSVYTYSLSWAPDEAPTREEMLEAGLQTLKVLGLDSHETLMVAHRDEPHPHLHLIVNRVHPETGLAAKLSKDHLDLSKWAEAYERRQGKIRCEQRVINNAARRQRRTFVRHRNEITSADYRRWVRAQDAAVLARGPLFEPDLPQHPRAQRQALHDAKQERILRRRLQIREANRSKWAFLFRQQKAEKHELDQTRRSAIKRLLYWVSHRQEIKARGGLVGAFQALIGYHGPEFHEAMAKRHEQDRKALARSVNNQIRDAIAHEDGRYRIDLEALKAGQAAELATLRALKATIRDYEDSRQQDAEHRREEAREKPMRQQFRDRVRKRIKKAKKRDDRGKGNERERE
jgi:hypothetical protein